MTTLVTTGLLERSNTGKYIIGPALYTIGNLYLNATDILKAAEPVVAILNNLTGEVASIGILENEYTVIVMRKESKYGFRWSHVGSLLPAHASAMGKALLSELNGADLDSLYPEEILKPVNPKTIKTKTELRENLEQIKKTGISVSQEELVEGIGGIARAIRDASGKAVAALSIGVPVFKLNEAYHSQIVTMVRLGASLASYRLGYQNEVPEVRDIEEIRSWWEQNPLERGPIIKDGIKIEDVALPYLTELNKIVNESVSLSVLEGDEAVSIQHIESTYSLRFTSQVGGSLPLHSTAAGKMLLSHLSDRQVQNLLNHKTLFHFTENTITEVADIMPELAMVRREGIAIDNQETELGVRCLAAPVKDNNGEIIAAVSVSGPTTRLNIGRVQELKSLVRSTGLEISQEFGYGGN